MKRLTIAVMCLLMCFSTVTPTTALAKCAHKKAQWQTTQKATCCNTGVKKLICKNCGKALGHKWSSWKKNFLTGKYTRHCTRSGCDATQHKK